MIPPRTTPNGFSSAAKPIVASWKELDKTLLVKKYLRNDQRKKEEKK